MITLNRTQHISLQALSLALLIINWQFLHWPILGIIVSLLFFTLNSKKLGDILFIHISGNFRNVLGWLTILLYFSIIYTLFYHVWQINAITFLFALISVPLIIEFWSWRLNKQHYFFTTLDIPSIRLANIKNIILPTLFLITELLTIILLTRRSSVEIIRSPWELLGYKFWTLLIVASILLVIMTIQNKKSTIVLFLTSIHFFILASVAWLVYPLGFGYDPFLHQAAMEVIDKTSTIQPRLFLYLGQYSWTFFLHSLWQLPIATINKLVLPIAFSILWPHSLYYGLNKGFRWPRKISLLAVLLSLFAGFNFAIITTPQNLAFLLVATFIFILPVIKKHKQCLYFCWIIGLGTLTIHPLGGIPILYMSLLLSIRYWKIKKKFKKYIHAIIVFLSAISLPTALALYQRLAGQNWSQIFTWHPWPLIDWSWPKLVNSYNFPIDLIHNIWNNYALIFIIIVLLGWLIIVKKHKYLFFNKHWLLLSILLSNYILARVFISFSNQIDYEQNAYLLRIIYLIGLSVMPIFLSTWYFWWHNILAKQKNLSYKIWIGAITVMIIIISTYFSYPTYDRHSNSKSFNITAVDVETVRLIEQSSNDQDYIVLANQMVGAAAIDAYGFVHYYNDNFYYSMPLGNNNIYQNYLNMIEHQASHQEAKLAMDKAGVNKLYFVVNNYWHSAKQAINQAKETADDYFVVGQDKSYIFIYNYEQK
ncbi:hypothetical protein HOC14_04135 [bacterium]|mgnify:FL=1|nr:hypothetical protein [bacterium]